MTDEPWKLSAECIVHQNKERIKRANQKKYGVENPQMTNSFVVHVLFEYEWDMLRVHLLCVCRCTFFSSVEWLLLLFGILPLQYPKPVNRLHKTSSNCTHWTFLLSLSFYHSEHTKDIPDCLVASNIKTDLSKVAAGCTKERDTNNSEERRQNEPNPKKKAWNDFLNEKYVRILCIRVMIKIYNGCDLNQASQRMQCIMYEWFLYINSE